MFKDQSLFAILEEGKSNRITRIEVTRDSQKDIYNLFGKAYETFNKSKQAISFDGCYKPDMNEVLSIKDFKISDEIIEAIKNPIGVRAFVPEFNNPPIIKALFIGKRNKKTEGITIAFQRFRKEQYISRKGLNLFHDSNTFDRDKRYGICINDIVDCIFEDGNLKFQSYNYARQIFDLSEYYREATDSDVEDFISNIKIQIEDTNIFKVNADSWVRRKIALISDSGIFEKYSPKQIKERASNIGIKISTSQSKIKLPNDKKELKNILKFLDDEIYKGIFSEQILQTNSKRRAEI